MNIEYAVRQRNYGHYAVEILPKGLMNSNECENILKFDINTNQQSKITCMDKIHKQLEI